jgi:hypothetical protein
MSITGFYDALSVKTWTENRLDAFQAYCAVHVCTVRTQPRNLHDFNTYLYACAVPLGNHVF